jgi:uncharacterized protein (TIGR02301 family)
VKRLIASSLAAVAALAAQTLTAQPVRAAAPAAAVAPLATQTQTAQPVKPAAPAAKPTPAATPTPTPSDTPPPYEAQLLRLAEIIGALTYLRDLCSDGDGAAFRAKFADLVGAEGTTDARKESLAGAFNRGFRDYELTYRACTPTAREIVARFLDEASRIAKDVANRFSG